uniref:Uncharacterized protein AlNc14C289G10212 n=1 Tax=Albugo laibachii Nc14 TaxID=890382 RepID=F0WV67_9STRA|nr:conserved hypothetical protein [Albugo laibachii Nc14]|eukprot:CCA25306.1 conserved hypothetical protein [Albugo laibachii Nc14]
MAQFVTFLHENPRYRRLLFVSTISVTTVWLWAFSGSSKRYIYLNPRLNTIDLRPSAHEKIRNLWRKDEMECLGWRATHACDPYGLRDPYKDLSCDQTLPHSAGYCEIRNRTSGQVHHVMRSTCLGWVWNTRRKIKCNDALKFTEFSIRAAQEPSEVFASIEDNTNTFIQFSNPSLLESIEKKIILDGGDTNTNLVPKKIQYGVVMVVYPRIVAGVYGIVRMLRDLGCTLPVEIWYHPREMTAENSILIELYSHYNVLIRVIEKEDIKTFATKSYVIFHSTFEDILFLDSDNIPVRDPTFLFKTKQFIEYGAIFWPDFWHPRTETPFNIHRQSTLWEMLDMPYIEMFEQESGQLLINRRRHEKALRKLWTYTFNKPDMLVKLDLVYGDKDLFRLAWINTTSPFYMIPHVVRLGGIYSIAEDFFCGLAMIQHDPDGEILFVHRNQVKLNGRMDQEVVLTHIQTFTGKFEEEYRVQAQVENYKVKCKFHRLGQTSCFFLDSNMPSKNADLIQIRPFSSTGFGDVERNAIERSIEGRKLLTKEEESLMVKIEQYDVEGKYIGGGGRTVSSLVVLWCLLTAVLLTIMLLMWIKQTKRWGWTHPSSSLPWRTQDIENSAAVLLVPFQSMPLVPRRLSFPALEIGDQSTRSACSTVQSSIGTSCLLSKKARPRLKSEHVL